MKIICSDYDGTFNYGGVTKKRLEVIKKWRNDGNLFCIVSGRPKDFYFELKKAGIELDYLLSCNGALITDGNYNTVGDIKCETLTAKELTDYLFLLGCPFSYICCGETYKVKNPDFPEAEGEIGFPEEVINFNQISTALPTFEEAAEVTEKINKTYALHVNALQNGRCIDIVPFGMDKARGIYALLELTGGKYEDVIAVGDNINDEAMIKEFFSYAMENGVQSVKDLANATVKSVDELVFIEEEKLNKNNNGDNI